MSNSNTTIEKLRRYRMMKEAEHNAMGWLVNPKHHPLPAIIDLEPNQIEWLRGQYLDTISQSSPQLASEALELVAYYLKDVLPPDYDDEY